MASPSTAAPQEVSVGRGKGDAMSKAVFLDVDGTYMVGNVVPRSAADAVRRARANGHEVFLCTGRSLAEIYPHITEAGFDGIISAGGGAASYGDTTVLSYVFPPDLLGRALTFLDGHGIDYILETDTVMIGSPGCRRHLARVRHPDVDEETFERLLETTDHFVKPVVAVEDYARTDVRKVLFLGSGTPLDDIRAEFAGDLDVVGGTIPAFGENMGELALPDVHKASAIERLIAHAGIAREDTIAFGDGANDLEMLDYVAVGVAMGNANDAVKAAADLVVASADADGIADGFARLGLI